MLEYLREPTSESDPALVKVLNSGTRISGSGVVKAVIKGGLTSGWECSRMFGSKHRELLRTKTMKGAKAVT